MEDTTEALQLQRHTDKRRCAGGGCYLGSEGLRESSVRDADVSLQELHHGLGEGQLVGPLLHLHPAQVVLHHELGQVTHDLRGRRHLGDGREGLATEEEEEKEEDEEDEEEELRFLVSPAQQAHLKREEERGGRKRRKRPRNSLIANNSSSVMLTMASVSMLLIGGGEHQPELSLFHSYQWDSC